MDASVEVGPTRIEIEELKWSTTELRFRGFADLVVPEESPEFTSCGHDWGVDMHPFNSGGDGDNMMTSVYLLNQSDELKVRWEIILRGPGDAVIHHDRGMVEFSADADSVEEYELDRNSCWGTSVERSKVMESLIEGALVVDVKIRNIDPTSKSPFVPKNPHLKNSIKLFMDEETADVIFQVGIRDKKNQGKRKRGEESTDFHAHRLVLKHNAPVLAEFCGPGEREGALPVTVLIEDVDPDTFRHLLYYVYGGEIDGEDLREKAKEIIDAANKYGVVGLKLLAEACYVESTRLSIENMMEHLLYSDARSCALMKEAVVDFVLANDVEVLQRVSFRDCPGDLVKDLLAAMARSKKRGEDNDGNAADQFVTMRVDDLRRKLHGKGLDVDGSREAMIVALRESS